MERHLIWTKLGATLALVCTALTSCTHHRPPKRKDVIHVALSEPPLTLDPALASDTSSLEAVELIHETLYQWPYLSDETNPKPVPLLAADQPEISEDHKTYTIRIISSAYFQDHPEFKGERRPLKCEDFVLALKRLAIPGLDSPGWILFRSRIVGLKELNEKLAKLDIKVRKDTAIKTTVEGLSCSNDRTLVIKLIDADPDFLQLLTLSYSSPVPLELFKKFGDLNGGLSHPVIGTGAYIYSETKTQTDHYELIFNRRERVRPEFFPLEATPEQRKQGIQVDAGKPLNAARQIVFHVIEDERELYEDFAAGKIDWMKSPSQRQPGRWAQLEKEKKADIHALNGRTFYYLGFNLQNEILGKSRDLRQAISMAISRKKWNEIQFNGMAKPMTGFLPQALAETLKLTGLKTFADENLTAAKALLKKAGYPGGRGLPVFALDLRDTDMLTRKLAEFFQAELEQIGVRVEPSFHAFSEFIERGRTGHLEIFMGAWTLDTHSVEHLLESHFGADATATKYNSSSFNELLESYRKTPAGDARTIIVKKLIDQIAEDLPIAPGLEVTDYHVTQPWLRGFWRDYIGHRRLKYLHIDPQVMPQIFSKSP